MLTTNSGVWPDSRALICSLELSLLGSLETLVNRVRQFLDKAVCFLLIKIVLLQGHESF